MALATASPAAMSTFMVWSGFTRARVNQLRKAVRVRRELAGVGGELQLQRGGMAVEQQNHVVLITAAWRETRHDLVRQIIQRGGAAVLNEGGDAGDAVVQ